MRSPTQRALGDGELDAIVRRLLGRELLGAELLEGGTWSTAYRLSLDDGARAVLKVGPPPGVELLTYERDLAATEAHVCEVTSTVAGLPTPRLLGADLDGEVAGRELVVIEHLDGVPLIDVAPSFPDDVQERIRREFGAICARLHAVTSDRFGYVRTRPRSDGRDWRSTFLAMIDDLVVDARRIPTSRPTRAEEIAAAVRRHVDDLDAVHVPVLVHFDLWDGNVLVDADAGRITGIIDGERAFYGDPLAELASVALMARRRFLAPVMDGYLAERGVPSLGDAAAVERRLAFYRLYLHLLMVIEPVTRGYPVDEPPPHLDRVHEEIEQDLQLLDRPR